MRPRKFLSPWIPVGAVIVALLSLFGGNRELTPRSQARLRRLSRTDSIVRSDKSTRSLTVTTAATPTDPPQTPFDPDDDDRLIGRVLSRREVLALMGAGSVAVVVAACAPGSSASGSPSAAATGAAGTTSPSASTAAVASSLPSCVVVPELTEGPVLRQREPRPLRHPDRHLRWLGQRRCRPDPRLGRLAGRRQRVHPARGRPGRCLALRRARQLLGRRQRAGPRLPAWVPAHRRQRQGDDHDHLPGLVPGPRRPHPLQDPHRCGRGQRARVHVAAVLR